jgi:Cytochrome c, mono- and diheme variants
MLHRGAFLAGAIFVVLGLAGLAAAVAYGGFYDVAGDSPHTGPVYNFLQKVRMTSIAANARSVTVPADLAGSKRIADGGAEYGEMCAQCHLGPDVEKTEIASGLYPAAPTLARDRTLTPAEQFWVIKHGIKFTAMPAWGKTHSDDLLWNIVAFVQALPNLSEGQYKSLTAEREGAHDQLMQGMDTHNDESGDHHH